MKTNLRTTLLLGAIFTLIYACKKIDTPLSYSQQDKVAPILLTPEEIISISYDTPRELSVSEILSILRDFPIEKSPDLKEGSRTTNYTLQKKYYLNTQGELLEARDNINTKSSVNSYIPIYKADVSTANSKGFAFICADERLPEVIAYIPKVNLNESIISEHPMFILSIATVNDRISYYKQLKDSLREKTLDKIKRETGINVPEKDVYKLAKTRIKPIGLNTTKSEVIPNFPTALVSKVGPFTKTAWDQGGIFGMDNAYNHKMPIISCDGSSVRAPAGCVTVAVSQILAHLTPTMSVPNYTDESMINIDWGLLKQTPDLDYEWPGVRYDMMGSLMRCVADGMSSGYQCSEGSALTSATMSDAINYIRRYRSISNLQNFNVQTCKQSLDNLKIVLASGDRTGSANGKVGHAWIVDGYAICRKGTVNGNNGTSDLVNRFDMYLHCNLGWGQSDATGWYLVNVDWSVTFDTRGGEGENRQHYRLNLKCAPNAS